MEDLVKELLYEQYNLLDQCTKNKYRLDVRTYWTYLYDWEKTVAKWNWNVFQYLSKLKRRKNV